MVSKDDETIDSIDGYVYSIVSTVQYEEYARLYMRC
jgi:hypothetical protein